MSTELEKPDQPVISLFFFGVFAIVLHIFFIFEDEAGDEFYLESITFFDYT